MRHGILRRHLPDSRCAYRGCSRMCWRARHRRLTAACAAAPPSAHGNKALPAQRPSGGHRLFRPFGNPGLWVFDLDRGHCSTRNSWRTGAAPASGSAERFSNVEGSRHVESRLFRATETYDGANGYSLRLDGLEPGFNDRALDRAIVMHGGHISAEFARRQGRIGRSWGCPAVRWVVARRMFPYAQARCAALRLLPRSQVAREVVPAMRRGSGPRRGRASPLSGNRAPA